jgi:hypothetical protein
MEAEIALADVGGRGLLVLCDIYIIEGVSHIVFEDSGSVCTFLFTLHSFTLFTRLYFLGQLQSLLCILPLTRPSIFTIYTL